MGEEEFADDTGLAQIQTRKASTEMKATADNMANFTEIGGEKTSDCSSLTSCNGAKDTGCGPDSCCITTDLFSNHPLNQCKHCVRGYHCYPVGDHKDKCGCDGWTPF